MSLDETNIIDFVSITNANDLVILTVADADDWNDEEVHLDRLQDKLNAYIDYFASEQIWKDYPEHQDATVRIDVYFKHKPTRYAVSFLKKCKKTIAQCGASFKYYVDSGE